MKGILSLIISCVITVSAFAADCDAPMTKERFASLYETIEMKQSDQQRYQLIKAYASRECVTVSQLAKFLELIEEHKVKVSLTHETYEYLFDKENIEQITQDFTEHEKQVVKKNTSRK